MISIRANQRLQQRYMQQQRQRNIQFHYGLHQLTCVHPPAKNDVNRPAKFCILRAQSLPSTLHDNSLSLNMFGRRLKHSDDHRWAPLWHFLWFRLRPNVTIYLVIYLNENSSWRRLVKNNVVFSFTRVFYPAHAVCSRPVTRIPTILFMTDCWYPPGCIFGVFSNFSKYFIYSCSLFYRLHVSVWVHVTFCLSYLYRIVSDRIESYFPQHFFSCVLLAIILYC